MGPKKSEFKFPAEVKGSESDLQNNASLSGGQMYRK